MRIAGETGFRFGNADLCQQFQRPRPRGGTADAAVQLQDLADLRLDRMQRVERRHRLLEDDRDVVAANAPDLVLRQVDQFAALEVDAARRMRRGRIRQQLQDRQRADGFAGAGFTDQRHALAALDLEGNMVDRDRGPARLVKRHRQIADIEQRLVDDVHYDSASSKRGRLSWLQSTRSIPSGILSKSLSAEMKSRH